MTEHDEILKTGAVSGKALSIMDWGVNNAVKNLKDIEPKAMMDVALISSIDPVDVGLASSEKANSAPSIKPKKKTMTSIYLKFFETAPDGKSRKCNFC